MDKPGRISKMKNMKANIAILASIGLAVVLIACSKRTENTDAEKMKSYVLWRAQSDGLLARNLLIELREGRITNAIESLEFSIDCSIVQIGTPTNHGASARQEFLPALRLMKDYRQKYPRKSEEAIAGLEGDELRTNLEITKEAGAILDKVK
jgi:hypothetical protein